MEKASHGLNVNYGGMIQDWHSFAPYAISASSGKYDPGAKCVMCKTGTLSHVFFPCRHMCVCLSCIQATNIGPRGDDIDIPAGKEPWTACAVCMQEIKIVLRHDEGKEHDRFWAWVHKVKPPLSYAFKQEFREAAERMRNGKSATKHTQSLDDAASACCSVS